MSKRFESNIESEIAPADKVVPVLCCVFLLVLSLCGSFKNIDNHFYDFLLGIKCKIVPTDISPKLLSVDLTDKTETLYSQEIETRQIFVDIMQIIKDSNVRAAGFDFLFSGYKNKDNDTAFAQYANDISGCVFAIVPLTKNENTFYDQPLSDDEKELLRKMLWHPVVINSGKIPYAKRFLLPYGELTDSSALFAHIDIEEDKDGIYRRLPLFYRWENGYIPAYSLALAVQTLGIDTDSIVLNAGKSVILDNSSGTKIIIPVDEYGCVTIQYTGKWETTGKRLTVDTFKKAVTDEDTFWDLYDLIEGNVLLFSDLTMGKKDYGISPLEPVFPLSGIHTAVLNGILLDRFYRELPFWGKILIGLLLFFLVLFSVCQKQNTVHNILFGSGFIILTLLCGVLWFGFLVMPWYTGIQITLVVSWIVSFIFRTTASYKEKLLLGNALSRYFPHALAKRILKEGKTELKPAKKELTMLFSDIAGFTKWSSEKNPEEVHSFLSDYLGSMSEIIFNNGGTVDKFMGDGILAFFGDPYEQNDHPKRAVKTAIEMQKKVRELANKWKPLVGIDLETRIGINTGEVIVGNLGSDIRIDYTVIGSAVNLASRMESNAPVGGILVSQSSYKKVKDVFLFSEPIAIYAKGYEEPILAYVVKF